MSLAETSSLDSTESKPAARNIAATAAESLVGLESFATFRYAEFPITSATRFSASAGLKPSQQDANRTRKIFENAPMSPRRSQLVETIQGCPKRKPRYVISVTLVRSADLGEQHTSSPR